MALILVAVIAVGVIILITVLGSSSASPGPTPSATSTPTATAAPSATPSPTPPSAPETPPALDTLFVSPAGLGPVRIGEPLSGAALLMAQPTEEDCSTRYWRTAESYVVPDGGYSRRGGDAFTVWGDESGDIQRIDVLSPGIATEEGLRTGMPVAEVTRLYPDAVQQPAAVSTLWIVRTPGSAGQMIIEVAGSDASLWGERSDTVAFIRVVSADAVPTAIASTDDVVGTCLDYG